MTHLHKYIIHLDRVYAPHTQVHHPPTESTQSTATYCTVHDLPTHRTWSTYTEYMTDLHTQYMTPICIVNGTDYEECPEENVCGSSHHFDVGCRYPDHGIPGSILVCCHHYGVGLSLVGRAHLPGTCTFLCDRQRTSVHMVKPNNITTAMSANNTKPLPHSGSCMTLPCVDEYRSYLRGHTWGVIPDRSYLRGFTVHTTWSVSGNLKFELHLPCLALDGLDAP